MTTIGCIFGKLVPVAYTEQSHDVYCESKLIRTLSSTQPTHSGLLAVTNFLIFAFIASRKIEK
jgi:hypothetical protein